jgi:hypothetical protein
MDATEALSAWAKEAQIITLQMLPQQFVVWTPRQCGCLIWRQAWAGLAFSFKLARMTAT